MPNRSLVDDVTYVMSLEPQNLIINNTTIAGAATDVSDCDAVNITAHIGAWGDTVAGGKMEFAIQHSDDTVAGNFTDVANADLSDSVTISSTVTGAAETGGFATVSSTATDQKIVKTGYIGKKKYIRHKINGEKNLATGTPATVVIEKMIPNLKPTTGNANS